jgi:hypothetical protein
MMFGRNDGTAAVIQRIPIQSVGVEIGVWKGGSSSKFLTRASHLHMVDPWSVGAYKSSDEHGGFNFYLHRYSKMVGGSGEDDFQGYYDKIYEAVVSEFADKPVTIHRCTSADFFASSGPVDWVYVDGSHAFDGCLADLYGAWGIASYAIFGDDYGTKVGVTLAVNSFIADTGLKLDVFGGDQYQICMT